MSASRASQLQEQATADALTPDQLSEAVHREFKMATLPERQATKEALKATPPLDDPYRAGLSSLERGDFDQAIVEFSKAIERGHKDVFPYLKRALTHERKGDRDSAIADYRKALTMFTEPASLKKEIDAAIKRLVAKR